MWNLERYYDIFQKMPIPHLSERVPHILLQSGDFGSHNKKFGPQGILDGFLGFFETMFGYGFNFNEG
jgi:hypothetical protein